MTPAVPPLPTIWNLPFQPSLGIQTSNCTAGLVTPATRQIGTGSVPTGAGFAPAGSISVSVIVVSAMLSLVLRSAQAMGFAASTGIATSAPDTATAEKNAQSGPRSEQSGFMTFLLVGLRICRGATLKLLLNLCLCAWKRESARGSHRQAGAEGNCDGTSHGVPPHFVTSSF